MKQPRSYSAAASAETLNGFLRGELAAVEAYRHVIAKLAGDSPHQLDSCLGSHQARVERIRQRIEQFGGTAAQGPRWWGGFTLVVESISTWPGKHSAFVALEQSEHQAHQAYVEDLPSLDDELRRFVMTHLLPEQILTLTMARSLLERRARSMNGASSC